MEDINCILDLERTLRRRIKSLIRAGLVPVPMISAAVTLHEFVAVNPLLPGESELTWQKLDEYGYGGYNS